MMKVMTIVGTRPEIIKLSCLIRELDKYTRHLLVHTGQNFDYELNGIFFEQMNIRKPDYFLEAAGKNAAESIGNIIIRADRVLEKESPDAVVIYGDTNSCLSAIAAKRRKIPIFHLEAGNRCFDQRVPEEINRKIIDHISDINMPISEHARRYLIAEGLKPETIIKTGSMMQEVINEHIDQIGASQVLLNEGLEPDSYVLVSAHREENIDDVVNLNDLLESIPAISKEFGKKVIISTHPRTQKKLHAIGFENTNPGLSFCKPFGFIDYMKLQMKAFIVISDSGTITEESSILGFPAITIRNAHERPEGMDEGTLVMTGLKKENILNAIRIIRQQMQDDGFRPTVVQDYTETRVAAKVLRIILSYTPYVNQFIWKKNSST